MPNDCDAKTTSSSSTIRFADSSAPSTKRHSKLDESPPHTLHLRSTADPYVADGSRTAVAKPSLMRHLELLPQFHPATYSEASAKDAMTRDFFVVYQNKSEAAPKTFAAVKGSTSPDAATATRDFLQPLEKKAAPNEVNTLPHSLAGPSSSSAVGFYGSNPQSKIYTATSTLRDTAASGILYSVDPSTKMIVPRAENVESWSNQKPNRGSSDFYFLPEATALHCQSEIGNRQGLASIKQRASLASESYERGKKLQSVQSEEDGMDEDHLDSDNVILLKKGDVMQRFDGRGNDAKPNTPRSRHSATEQRRRSKINDRFQMLRQLVPNNDQKRDKASILLEAIEYIQSLQEKAKTFEDKEQLKHNETSKPAVDTAQDLLTALDIKPTTAIVCPAQSRLPSELQECHSSEIMMQELDKRADVTRNSECNGDNKALTSGINISSSKSTGRLPFEPASGHRLHPPSVLQVLINSPSDKQESANLSQLQRDLTHFPPAISMHNQNPDMQATMNPFREHSMDLFTGKLDSRVQQSDVSSSMETQNEDTVVSSSDIKVISGDSKRPAYLSRDDQTADQELRIQGGSISISSSYSQGLLEKLTQALQIAGLDLSQACISVQIDLGGSGVLARSPHTQPMGSRLNADQTQESRGHGKNAHPLSELESQSKKPKLEKDC